MPHGQTVKSADQFICIHQILLISHPDNHIFNINYKNELSHPATV